jgi:hypothetical protein
MDGNLVGYAVLASPPANYKGVIKGVTVALEKLEETLLLDKFIEKQCRRGNFKTLTFGCSYGSGQKVT